MLKRSVPEVSDKEVELWNPLERRMHAYVDVADKVKGDINSKVIRAQV